MSAVGSQSVSKCGRPDDAFSRRANHASMPTLDVCTGRLQWRTALHGRGHHKIEHTLEASLLQMRPRRLGGHDLYRVPEIVTRGRFPDGGESDSTWRTQEARHVGSDTIAPGF